MTHLSAIVLAAGQSTRMGTPKMLLPWGNTTVLGQVIETLQKTAVQDLLVITGGAKESVEASMKRYSVRLAHNDSHGEMLASIQTGLRGLSHVGGAVMIALGDQPQIEEKTARDVIAAWQKTGSGIVMPSYQKRRGHPWLIAQTYWQEILSIPPEKSMRDFFRLHDGEIFYVNVETPSILQDLDTPEDYKKYKP